MGQIRRFSAKPKLTAFGVLMNRPVARFVLLLSVLGAAACERTTTAPEGTPSDVSVRAYVDANGSGVFDTGDTPIAGAAIKLVAATTTDTLTATTDANGVALFTSVRPGSYTANFAGTVPAGAVLATAPQPVVVAPIAGGTVSAEFRYAFNPGSVTGTVFRDDNGSGTFDAGDTPAGGLTVRIFSGPDTTAAPVATTTTGSNGSFTFNGLRPGNYTVLFTPFPTIQLAGGNFQAVTVTAAQPTTISQRFTGSLVIPISQARANNPTDSALVAVEGRVVAGLGTFNARSIYIEDATGGIQVFGVDTATIKPALGDSVRVVGKVIAFNQELEIIQPTVTRLGTGAVPAPRPVTGAEINAFQRQGELVKASGVTVVSVGTPSGSGAYNVTVRDAAGTSFIVRIANNGIGVPNTTWTVGNTYDVSGILIRFNATAELEPRSAADVVAGLPLRTIAQARTIPSGDTTTFMVQGSVVAGLGTFNARSIYIEDATGGIQVFGVDTANIKPQLGDIVRVTGKMSSFNQELEIVTPSIIKVGSGAVPAPTLVTGAEINALQHQGELVTTDSVTVVSVGTVSGSGGYNVTVRDAAGTNFVVRVASNGIGIPSTFWTVGAAYDVTGILIRFNATAQLEPRSAADAVAH